eukprot:tig00000630_g2716.t1
MRFWSPAELSRMFRTLRERADRRNLPIGGRLGPPGWVSRLGSSQFGRHSSTLPRGCGRWGRRSRGGADLEARQAAP